MGEPRSSKQRQEDEDAGKNEGKTFGELKNEQNRRDIEKGDKKK